MDGGTLLDRIHQRPHVVSGQPTVRGLRVTVDHILGLLANGVQTRDILDQFPELEPEDIDACVAYSKHMDHCDSD